MADDKNLDLFKEVREADRKALCLGKKLRVGFIGTGGIAHSHMRAYKQFDDIEVVAGADLRISSSLCCVCSSIFRISPPTIFPFSRMR